MGHFHWESWGFAISSPYLGPSIPRCKLSVSTKDFHRCGFNRTMGPSTRRSAKSLSSAMNYEPISEHEPHKKWIGFHDSSKIRWFCIKLVQHILVNSVFTTRIFTKNPPWALSNPPRWVLPAQWRGVLPDRAHGLASVVSQPGAQTRTDLLEPMYWHRIFLCT